MCIYLLWKDSVTTFEIFLKAIFIADIIIHNLQKMQIQMFLIYNLYIYIYIYI